MSGPDSPPSTHPITDVVGYYSDHYDEDSRLVRPLLGRLELARTQSLLRRLLPSPPIRVLDVGGGTGVHAEWLVRAGYDVHIIDLVPAHVERARARGLSAAVGDARSIALAGNSVDAVLLLGPLYHLIDRSDRVQALSEAARVVRPGGPVAGAVISRYASLLDFGARGLVDQPVSASIEQTLRTGRHDPRIGFTTAYFHRPEELVSEFGSAGLQPARVFGIEGPAWQVLKAADGWPDGEDRLASAIRVAELVECDPAMIAASPHLLAVAPKG